MHNDGKEYLMAPNKKIKKIFSEFRVKLDDIMLKAMHNRVILYGYESYTGRFIEWYAEYYHSIKIDYLVSTDMSRSGSYKQEIFRSSIFELGYKDVKDAIVWVVEPMTNEIQGLLEENGYVKDKTYFDFCATLYGEEVEWKLEKDNEDVFRRRKKGRKDIQFFEWLEWKYNCNFLTAIESSEFKVAYEHGASYRCSTQKEIFPILDKCHCIPDVNDRIFDYGCGKGSALISFLDYGFKKCGGVEYEPEIYKVLVDNFTRLKIEETEEVELIQGDAATVDVELDKYNWFYFFVPFDNYVFSKCVKNLIKSYERNRRRLHIISIVPLGYQIIEDTGIFRLVNQFTVETRQRVVDIFETIE